MAQKRDLPKSITWRIIWRLKYGQTQRNVADAAEVTKSVISRLWNRFQETGNVRHRPVQGLPRSTSAFDDGYILLTAGRDIRVNVTQLQRQLLLATERRFPAKQSEIGFIKLVSIHVDQWCVFHPLQDTVRPEEGGLLNFEIVGNVIGIESTVSRRNQVKI